MNRRFDDTILGKLVKFWPLIISLVIVASAFAVMGNEIKYCQKSLDSNTSEHSQNLKEHRKMEERITRLEDAVIIIPEQLREIRGGIGELHKEMVIKNSR